MKFLADLGISQTVMESLREHAYDAVYVRDEDMHRASDSDIIKKAKQ